MFKITVTLGLIAFNCLLTTKALSQNKVINISSILENPIDGEEVILRGKIIGQQTGEKDYIFTDGKDEIIIELEENNFLYNPNEDIEISGIVNLESEHSQQLEQDLSPEDIEISVNDFKVIDIE